MAEIQKADPRALRNALVIVGGGVLFGGAGRYPPPGLRVVRDTPVVVGEAAGRRGRLLQVFAVVMGLAGLLLAFFLWRFVSLLESRLTSA